MKKIILLLVTFSFLGCSTIKLPNYVKDKNPYKKTFYSDFEKTLPAVKAALQQTGWKLVSEAHPSIYEIGGQVSESLGSSETILFTDTRVFGFFLGTSFYKINVYLRSVDKNSTDIEIRYIKVTSILFKNFESYKKDSLAKKLFNKIEMKINE